MMIYHFYHTSIFFIGILSKFRCFFSYICAIILKIKLNLKDKNALLCR